MHRIRSRAGNHPHLRDRLKKTLINGEETRLTEPIRPTGGSKLKHLPTKPNSGLNTPEKDRSARSQHRRRSAPHPPAPNTRAARAFPSRDRQQPAHTHRLQSKPNPAHPLLLSKQRSPTRHTTLAH